MKRSIQEIVELVIFALIALVVLTGVLWLTGWLLGLLGSLFVWLAGILWLLLVWIIPVVLIIAAVYFLVRLLQRQSKKQGERRGTADPPGKVSGRVVAADTAPAVSVNPAPPTSPQTAGGGASSVHEAAVVREVQVSGEPSSELLTGNGDTQAATHSETGDDVPPPADAPVTTVQASGEPVEPYGALAGSADDENLERSGDAVAASGEPVLDANLEPVADAEVKMGTVTASSEPIVALEPEPVEQDGQQTQGAKQDADKNDKGSKRGRGKKN